MRPHPFDAVSLFFGLLFITLAVTVPVVAGLLPSRPGVVLAVAVVVGAALVGGALSGRSRKG